jgi:chemotaxis protein methyltransferase CheR
MIYFDKQTQQKVVQKFQRYVKPGGYFVVGHSESLSGIKHGFKYIAPTIYRKMT